MTNEKLYDTIKAWRDSGIVENGDGCVCPVKHK